MLSAQCRLRIVVDSWTYPSRWYLVTQSFKYHDNKHCRAGVTVVTLGVHPAPE